MPDKDYPPRTWVDPRLFVKESAINGQGLFCSQGVRAGELLMIWGGVPVRKDRFDMAAYRFASVVPIGEEHYLALPSTDPADSLDEYLNHSCDPSAWLVDEVRVVARRDLAAGEEITVDAATWDDGTLTDYAPGGRCTCGSAKCRGTLSPEDWRLPELQREYAGHFSPFLAERIRRLNEALPEWLPRSARRSDSERTARDRADG
jgi:hypothetical protein